MNWRKQVKIKRNIAVLVCISMFAGIVPNSPIRNSVAAADAIGNAQLDATEIYFPSTYVYGDISLPSRGSHGSQITWETSDDSIMGNDGRVNRPGPGEPDAVVQLTAKVSDGSQTLSKQYIFTILAESEVTNLEQFNLNDVEITDDYYRAAQESDIAFLKKFDTNRVLFRFRETAKLDTRGAQTYNGWENSYIAGHTVGHYLTAVAQAVQATGDSELDQKLKDIIHGLRECQTKVGTGFIFGAQLEDRNYIEKQFDIVEGKTNGNTWVPWYTMHKIVAGLVDTYKYTGNEEALQVANDLGEWIYRRVNSWDTNVNNRILGTEYGGMNDCLYELYSYTKNTHHRDAAHKFDDLSLYRIITSGNKNTLSGRHANATIPKFVGSIKRYEVLKQLNQAGSSDDEYLEVGKKFFDLVTSKHAYINGGVSDMEHFKDDNSHDQRRTQCNNESCCAYNLLKISKELYKITGDRKYADYYENTLRNAIMGAINTKTGATTYFTPMATGYFKTFGTADPATNMFWCCTGSGIENFTKLGDSIYFHKNDEIFVNQYISSKVKWEEGNMVLTQTSDVTKSDIATFGIELLSGSTQDATISLRVPDWIAGTPIIKVNGETDNNVIVSGGYVKLRRTWSDGDECSIQYPMEVKAFGLSDNGTAYAFKYGPTVLAAKLGTASMDKTTWAGANLTAPLIKVVGREQASLTIGYNNAPRQILGTETITITEDLSLNDFMESIDTFFVRDENEDVPTFKLEGTDAGDNFQGGLTFVPFNILNNERYGIYWYFESSVQEVSPEKILADKKEARLGKSIIDSLQPGYGQYERDALHQMTENNSVAGEIEKGGSTRYAKSGGYFEYNMIVDTSKNNSLLCHFAKADNGKTIKISIGDTVVKEYTLDYSGSEDFYDVSFDLPADVVNAAATKITADDGNGAEKEVTVVPVKFESAENADSARLVGGLYMTIQFGKNATITSILCEGATVRQDENGFKVYVPATTTTAKYRVVIGDQYGLLYINDELVNDAKYLKAVLSQDETAIQAKVYAEDHETSKDYTITFIKGEAPIIIVNEQGEEIVVPVDTPVITTPQQAVVELDQTTIPANITVYKGMTTKLDITYSPTLINSIAQKIVSIKSVEFRSSDPSIATVLDDGTVKGINPGMATITVKITLSTDASVTLTSTVTVKKPTFKIIGKKVVKKGKKIKYKVKKFGISGKVKWSVNKKKIAKINKKGVLKGIKKGKVKVTAKINKMKKSIKVKVKK